MNTQERIIVEINISTAKASPVETSDAPILTAHVLKSKAKPIQTVEIDYEGEMYQVAVRHGHSLEVEVQSEKLKPAYFNGRDVSGYEPFYINFLLAKMIVNPVLGYDVEDEGVNIWTINKDLQDTLFQAYLTVNHPDDDIYQIQVRRGVPEEVWYRLSVYPKVERERLSEMSDAELSEAAGIWRALRKIIVSTMIASPVISESEGGGYPPDEISEKVMQTLLNAFSIVNPNPTFESVDRFWYMA